MSNYRKIIVNSLLSESNKFDVGDFVVYTGNNKDLNNKVQGLSKTFKDSKDDITIAKNKTKTDSFVGINIPPVGLTGGLFLSCE